MKESPKALLTLGHDDLPALSRAASAASLRAQRRYNVETLLGVILLLIAAIAGLFVWKVGSADWAGVIAAFSFFLGIILQLDRLLSRPDRAWYEGRAIAESTKTLAWRYAVGGAPFEVDTLSPPDAESQLAKRLLDILVDVKTPIIVESSGEGDQITLAMRGLRARSLAERRDAYLNGRVEDQRTWYAKRATWNQRRSQLWNTLLLLSQIAGAAVALLKAVGILQIDLLGLATTISAIVVSWLEYKQHAVLAQAYAIAANELATIKAGINDQHNEADWARFVNDAEEAISREHTLWRASHTTAL